jgi:hypothetical protein
MIPTTTTALNPPRPAGQMPRRSQLVPQMQQMSQVQPMQPTQPMRQCPGGLMFDPATGNCVAPCPPGYVVDPLTGSCVAPSSGGGINPPGQMPGMPTGGQMAAAGCPRGYVPFYGPGGVFCMSCGKNTALDTSTPNNPSCKCLPGFVLSPNGFDCVLAAQAYQTGPQAAPIAQRKIVGRKYPKALLDYTVPCTMQSGLPGVIDPVTGNCVLSAPKSPLDYTVPCTTQSGLPGMIDPLTGNCVLNSTCYDLATQKSGVIDPVTGDCVVAKKAALYYTHTVSEGETTSHIAALHGVEISALVEANPDKPLIAANVNGQHQYVFAALVEGETLHLPQGD